MASDEQTGKGASVGRQMTPFEIARSLVGFSEQDEPRNDWISVGIARRHLKALAEDYDEARLMLRVLLEHTERIQEHVPKSEEWYAVRDGARKVLNGLV